MNLFAVINRGIDASGARALPDPRQARLDKAIEKTRSQWLSALTRDQIHAWSHIGEQDRPTLSGLSAVLTLAGLAHSFDTKTVDSVEVRVIRGAISAATQCAESADCVISLADARAFSAAATLAVQIVENCTNAAISHAAQHLHKTVNGGVQ